MKLKSIVCGSLVGVACMSFMLGTAAAGEKKASKSKTQYSAEQDRSAKPGVKVWRNKVVLVELTGSRIPQHVIIRGQNVNSASPVSVVQNDELHRTGAISIAGMLSLDPSISSGVPRSR
jgi:hypothetical protein